MKELQELRNYILELRNMDVIKKTTEITLLHKLNALEKQFAISGVVGSKRFKEQDLLRAYQAGAIEQQSINLDTLNFEKLKELTKDSEKWYERYTE